MSWWRAIPFVLLTGAAVSAGDLAGLYADRAAIERIYHNHRLGEKAPFEQAVPADLIERFVRNDLHKETVLKKVYSVDVTPSMLENEVRRIDSTTRAAEVLAEIKAALGNDPARFARSIARPLVVEQLLRRRFENDDALHAPQRRQAEDARAQLLAASDQPVADRVGILKSFAGLAGAASARVHDTTWRLALRPEDESPAGPAVPAPPTKNTSTAGPYTNESTARLAQPLDPPKPAADRRSYFSDLPPELQNVLKVQLTKAGDVSAVIESVDGFHLFLCREKSDTILSVHCLTIPKRSYEVWLEAQATYE